MREGGRIEVEWAAGGEAGGGGTWGKKRMAELHLCVCVYEWEKKLRSIPSALNYHSSTVCVCVFIPARLLMCVAAPTTPPNGE